MLVALAQTSPERSVCTSQNPQPPPSGSQPVISRWSWAGRVSRFIPTVILSGSSAQDLLARAKSSRYQLGREGLPSESGVPCQVSQGSQSCRTSEVQSRAPFQGLRCAWTMPQRQLCLDAPDAFSEGSDLLASCWISQILFRHGIRC